MSREGCVHLPGIQDNRPGRLRTFFWFRRVSLISPIQLNDPYDGSHYILHGTLILAVPSGQSTMNRHSVQLMGAMGPWRQAGFQAAHIALTSGYTLYILNWKGAEFDVRNHSALG